MFREQRPLVANQTNNNLNSLAGQKYQPYVSWKNTPSNATNFYPSYVETSNNTFYMNVASNFFPSINPNLNTSNNFINQKNQTFSRYKAKGRVNPIKHWRKQLIPINSEGQLKIVSKQVSIKQAIETPNGITKNTKNTRITNNLHHKDCSNNHTGINIPEYLINNDEKKICQNYQIAINDGKVIEVPVFNKERITRTASTKLKKNYYQSNSSYLRSRVKLYNQNQSLAPISGKEYYTKEPTTGVQVYIQPSNDPSFGTQDYHSTFSSDLSCNLLNIHNNNNAIKIIYKPSNFKFSNQGAVSSSLRALNLKKDQINKAAYGLKKEFETNVANNSRYLANEAAPITTKTYYENFNAAGGLCNSNHDISGRIQITNTQNSGKQPIGGAGRHTKYFETPTNKIQTSLKGNIVLREKIPKPWGKGPIYPMKYGQCQTILEALGKTRQLQNNHINYFGSGKYNKHLFSINHKNFLSPSITNSTKNNAPTKGTIRSASHR